jgi:hypothetical protein
MGLGTIRGWRQGAVQWDKADDLGDLPSDHTCDPGCVGVYIGTAGDVEVVDQHGNTVVFHNVPVGILEGRFAQLLNANTAALQLVELIFTGKR